MKKDYAYIALLDDETTKIVLSVQNHLIKEYGKSSPGWPPHITVTRGNLLTQEELEQVKIKLSSLKNIQPVTVTIGGFFFKNKSEDIYSLRIIIQPNTILQNLSHNVTDITSCFETIEPVPEKQDYWITVGEKISGAEIESLQKYLNTVTIPSEIIISSCSIFYSTFNEDALNKAYEIERFNFEI